MSTWQSQHCAFHGSETHTLRSPKKIIKILEVNQNFLLDGSDIYDCCFLLSFLPCSSPDLLSAGTHVSTMSFKYALLKYITHPENHQVLFYDDNVTIIQDAFPKSYRHYLVLPRDLGLTLKHPLDAFKNPDIYDEISFYVEKAKEMLVESIMESKLIPDLDYERKKFKNQFVKAGIHSIPSMSNLHIHVISQDFNLARMKNKKHYNSFTTDFFVEFEKLDPGDGESKRQDYLEPLDSESDWEIDNLQRETKNSTNPERDSKVLQGFIKDTPLKCVYCQKLFGNKFSLLKAHLSEEFGRRFTST